MRPASIIRLGLALAGLALGEFAAPAAAAVPTTELIVHVYDVGQGSCVLIECPGAPPILNDCGKKGSGGGEPPQVIGKIRDRLDDYRALYPKPLSVMISHPHEDHYSILTNRGFPKADIRSLRYAGPYSEFKTAKTWVDQLSIDLTRRAYRETCAPTAKVGCLKLGEHAFPTPRLSCGAVAVDLLTAGANLYNRGLPAPRRKLTGTTPNGDSAVLRLRYAGVSIVLPGDAEEVSQTYAIENARAAGLPLDRTTILLAPHHGSAEKGSNSEAWVAATSPDTVVISANEGGRYGHPYCKTLDRFEAARYAGGGEMAKISVPISMTCGLDSTHFEARQLTHQFVLTQNQGDVTITVGADGAVRITCERFSHACAMTPPNL